jgi:Cytochrome c3
MNVLGNFLFWFNTKIKTVVLTISLVLLAVHSGLMTERGIHPSSSPAIYHTGAVAFASPGSVSRDPEEDCSVCHVVEERSSHNLNLLAGAHTKSGETCASCHAGGDLEGKHSAVNSVAGVRVPAKKFSQQFCFKCHDSYANLIERTVSSKVYTDIKGVVVNPHNTHLSNADCNVCHRIHRISTGLNHCYTCHHAKVFACGTCHAIPPLDP